MANHGSYKEMLEAVQNLTMAASYVTGADDVGAFHPIRQTGKGRAYGEFSSLREYLEDFSDELRKFLDSDEGDEVESWDV